MQKSIRSFENGRTMLETLAVIVVIVLITIGSFWAYKNAAYQNEANLLYEEIISEVGARLTRGTNRVKDRGIVDSGWQRDTSYNSKKFQVEEDCPHNFFAVRVDEINEDVCKNLAEKDWGNIPVRFFRSRTKGDLCTNSNELDTSLGFYIHDPADCEKTKNGAKIKSGVFALIIPSKSSGTGGGTTPVDTCHTDEDCCGGCQKCDQNSQTCIDNCDSQHVCKKEGETCNCVDLPSCPAGKWRKNKVLLDCPPNAVCPGGEDCDFTCRQYDEDDGTPICPNYNDDENPCPSCCKDSPDEECLLSGEPEEVRDAYNCITKKRFECVTKYPNESHCWVHGSTRSCVECLTDADCEERYPGEDPSYRCNEDHQCVQCDENEVTEKCNTKGNVEIEKDEWGCPKYRKKYCSAEEVCDPQTNTCISKSSGCPGTKDQECSATCPCDTGKKLECRNSKCQCPLTLTKFWNESKNMCTECLVDYGKGNGSCPSTVKPLCNTSTWTCTPCEDGKEWSTLVRDCVAKCPSPLPGKGGSCTETCGCESGYKCDGGICKCDGECSNCTSDIDCSGNTTSGKTVCDSNSKKCTCPTNKLENSLGKCVDCWNETKRGEVISHGCTTPLSYCNESANNGQGICECPSPRPSYGSNCNSTCGCASGLTCDTKEYVCKCPTGTCWQNGQCTAEACPPSTNCSEGFIPKPDNSCVVCWNENNSDGSVTVHGCTDPLSRCDESDNGGLGKCQCPLTLPTKNENCNQTCGCASGELTCENDHICHCPSTLPGKDESCTETCGCSSGYKCDKGICKCDGECSSCTADKDCKGNTASGKTDCDQNTNQCICPSDMIENGSGKCVYCWNDGSIVRGCNEELPLCNESANNGLGQCVRCQENEGCTEPKSYCNEYADDGRGECICPALNGKVGDTCNETCGCKNDLECSGNTCQCKEGTYFNEETDSCLECLGEGRDYGSNLEGSCKTLENPKCNAEYKCEACPDGNAWSVAEQKCIPTYPPGKIIFKSGNTCCKGCSSCCGGTCAKAKKVTLYPGYYDVIVIGAAGGGAGTNNGHHSTNYGMGGTGGSGGSFKGVIKITSTEVVTVKTGAGGNAYDVKDAAGWGGSGGASSISGIITCPGGGGAYASHWHTNNSGGTGGDKCTVTKSKIHKTTKNAKGGYGSSGYCKHTSCSKYIWGSSPAISTKANYGAACGATIAFKGSKRYIYSGNCGYVQITYKGTL